MFHPQLFSARVQVAGVAQRVISIFLEHPTLLESEELIGSLEHLVADTDLSASETKNAHE